MPVMPKKLKMPKMPKMPKMTKMPKMPKMPKMTKMLNRPTLYSIAALLSIIFSFIAGHNFVINPDGICYLQSAESMSLGLSVASHVCEQAIWPIYSILIFSVMKITGLSSLTSSLVLDGLFSVISVLLFIAIIEQLTDSKRIRVLAAIVILAGHQFNGLRTEIIRDHGFWAFYLLSLFFFLRYFRYFSSPLIRKGGWQFAWGWSGALILATLFRIEGAIFLLFLPFVALFDTRKKWWPRVKSFLQLNSMTIAIGILLTLWMSWHATQPVGRLSEVEFQILHGVQILQEKFQVTAAALAQHVLNVYSSHEAPIVLFVMLMSWYVESVVTNVTLVYAVLIGYAWLKRLSGFDKTTRLVFLAYIIVNIVVTATFLVDHMFLAKRYLMALTLVLTLWVPFALEALVKQWPKRKWPLIVAGFFIFLYGLSGVIHFGYSKKYIRDAGEWLSVNAPANAKIYSNDYELLYYTNHFGNEIFTKGRDFEDPKVIAHGKWKKFDYLALRVNKKENHKDAILLRSIKLKPVAEFHNKRMDEVRIYKVKH